MFFFAPLLGNRGGVLDNSWLNGRLTCDSGKLEKVSIKYKVCVCVLLLSSLVLGRELNIPWKV